MKEYRNRNKDMYLQDWYDDYLMGYAQIFQHPKFSQEQSSKYTEKLLQWYDNWSGYTEEIK